MSRDHASIPSPIRVALCDRRTLLRVALERVIEAEPGFEPAWSISSPSEAPVAGPEPAADVLVIDFTSPTLEFLEQVARMREQHPHTVLIALTDHTSESCHLFQDAPPTVGFAQPRTCCLQQAFMLGARGAISVAGSCAELFRVIRGVMEGRVMVEEPSLSLLLGRLFGPGRQSTPAEQVTDRERQVINLLARGRSNKEIGIELGIHEQTVKNHVSHILEKLGLEDRVQIVVFAARHGLVSLDDY